MSFFILVYDWARHVQIFPASLGKESVLKLLKCPHPDTLTIESVTWPHNSSPICDLCNASNVQVERHILFHCTHPLVVSLRRTCASISWISWIMGHDVSTFLSQNNKKLYLHFISMSRLKAFSCKPLFQFKVGSPYISERDKALFVT